MNVNLNYFVDVDQSDEREFYFAEVTNSSGETVYSHLDALRSFSFREDMVNHVNRKCAELGWHIDSINDETRLPVSWEEYL